eukprot:4679087-Prymnesium_polylepis.2
MSKQRLRSSGKPKRKTHATLGKIFKAVKVSDPPETLPLYPHPMGRDIVAGGVSRARDVPQPRVGHDV